jgi:hypothetical protein
MESLGFLNNPVSYLTIMEPIVGLAYLAAGFVLTYLSLELAWHFTACKVNVANVKPCLFKKVKLLVVPPAHCRRP